MLERTNLSHISHRKFMHLPNLTVEVQLVIQRILVLWKAHVPFLCPAEATIEGCFHFRDTLSSFSIIKIEQNFLQSLKSRCRSRHCPLLHTFVTCTKFE